MVHRLYSTAPVSEAYVATCPCLSDDVPICPQPPQFQHRLYQTCLLPERNKCPTAAACPCQSHHHTSRSPGCAGVLGSCPDSRCLTLAFASLKLCDPRRRDSPLTYLSGPWLLQGWGWDDHTSCLVPHLPSGHHTTSHLSQSACLRALLFSLLVPQGCGCWAGTPLPSQPWSLFAGSFSWCESAQAQTFLSSIWTHPLLISFGLTVLGQVGTSEVSLAFCTSITNAVSSS